VSQETKSNNLGRGRLPNLDVYVRAALPLVRGRRNGGGDEAFAVKLDDAPVLAQLLLDQNDLATAQHRKRRGKL
jgi:hypothetical protein